MKVDSFRFGSITVDGKKYRHDVWILPDGRVEKRRGGFLMFGSHRITRGELEALRKEAGEAERIVIGLGTESAASVDEDVSAWAREAGVEILALPSEEAVDRLRRLTGAGGGKTAALIHVTC